MYVFIVLKCCWCWIFALLPHSVFFPLSLYHSLCMFERMRMRACIFVTVELLAYRLLLRAYFVFVCAEKRVCLNGT